MSSKIKTFLFLSFTAITLYFLFFHEARCYYQDNGFIYGTSYSLKFEYSYDQDKLTRLMDEVHDKLNEIDSSLSTFNKHSIISLINTNQAHQLDEHFLSVLHTASDVSSATGGAFDLTVAPLVNLWGFGFKNTDQEIPSPSQIDSIRHYVGMPLIAIDNNTLSKKYPQVMLDASAIAKGYAVDVIEEVLRSHGSTNYMIEIGGEISCKGKNREGKAWHIGIDIPSEHLNPTIRGTKEGLQDILKLSHAQMATSGNYRQYYYKDGKKVSHTISPFTGSYVEHTLLSATVLASSCARADAFATAFMVLGLEKSMEIVKNTKDLEAYFISSSGSSEQYQVDYSPGMEQLIAKNQDH